MAAANAAGHADLWAGNIAAGWCTSCVSHLQCGRAPASRRSTLLSFMHMLRCLAGGKSLTYQLPAVLSRGITGGKAASNLVYMPLAALLSVFCLLSACATSHHISGRSFKAS